MPNWGIMARHERRAEKAELREKKKELQEALDRQNKLREIGRLIVSEPSVSNILEEDLPDTAGWQHYKNLLSEGYELAILNLLWNPAAVNADHTHKIWPSNLSVREAKRIHEGIPIPKWARQIAENRRHSISKPNSAGWLTLKGEPNKALKGILKPMRYSREGDPEKGIQKRPERIQKVMDKALEWLRDDIISYFGGKLKLSRWDVEKFKEVMATAIASDSSPGITYKGKGWYGEMPDGRLVIEHVVDNGQIEKLKELDGYLYTLGARRTGDTGENWDDDPDKEGAQRLVAQAPPEEKVPGHQIADALKPYLKKSKLSGQHGPQYVGGATKRYCGTTVSEDSKHYKGWAESSASDISSITGEVITSRPITAIATSDVSNWDGSQRREEQDDLDWLIREVFDMTDDYTKEVVSEYQRLERNSRIFIGIGFLDIDILHSGSSKTTLYAFLRHYRILKTMELQGVKMAEVGVQGDDLIMLLYEHEGAQERMREVYSWYNCELKPGSENFVKLDQDDVACEFLGEWIRPLHDEDNFYSPKWNLFYAEDVMSIYEGSSGDRQFMQALSEHGVSISAKEKRFAALCGKLDRLDSEGRHYVLGKILNGTPRTPIASWMGKRVCPQSDTQQMLQRLEESLGLTPPEEAEQLIWREEDGWELFSELSVFVLATFAGMDFSRNVTNKKRILTIGKMNRKTFKEFRNNMSRHVNKSQPTSQLSKEIQSTFDLVFERMIDRLERVKTISEVDEIAEKELASVGKYIKTPYEVSEKMNVLTWASAYASAYISNPFQTINDTIEIIETCYDQPAKWNSLTNDDRELMEQSFIKLTGYSLEERDQALRQSDNKVSEVDQQILNYHKVMKDHFREKPIKAS